MSLSTTSEPSFYFPTGQHWHKSWLPGALLICCLLIILAGCSESAQSVPATTSPSATASPPTSKPAIQLDPATGYAGTFVNVSGNGWTPSTMVVIKLANEQGRTPVLAASTTDADGQFNTGFLYPIGERWLRAGPQSLVVATVDEAVAVETHFTVIPPTGVSAPTPLPNLTWLPLAVGGGSGATVAPLVTPPTSVSGQSPTVMVEPAAGGVNTPVTVSGAGFPAAARITVYLTDGDLAGDPRAGRYSYLTTSSNAAGEYLLTLTIPGAWPDGTPLEARPLAIVVVAEDFAVRAGTRFDLSAPAPSALAVPADTPLPTFTPAPSPTEVVGNAGASLPPQVQAALAPLTCANNRGEFQVVATADDPNGDLQAVVARIKLPWRKGEQRVQLKEGSQVVIKTTRNKIEIRAPDPEALLAQLQRDGGILVENGQVVMAHRKSGSQQEFRVEDGVWHVAAPALELQVSAADATGLTGAATVTANIACDEAPGDNANNEDKNKGQGKDKDD